MKKANTIDEIQQLKEQLQRVRQQSLAASRQNDFRTVARLTREAASLNRAIHVQEDFAGCASKSLAIFDALSEVGAESRFEFPEEPVLVAAGESSPAQLDEAA